MCRRGRPCQRARRRDHPTRVGGALPEPVPTSPRVGDRRGSPPVPPPRLRWRHGRVRARVRSCAWRCCRRVTAPVNPLHQAAQRRLGSGNHGHLTVGWHRWVPATELASAEVRSAQVGDASAVAAHAALNRGPVPTVRLPDDGGQWGPAALLHGQAPAPGADLPPFLLPAPWQRGGR